MMAHTQVASAMTTSRAGKSGRLRLLSAASAPAGAPGAAVPAGGAC